MDGLSLQLGVAVSGVIDDGDVDHVLVSLFVVSLQVKQKGFTRPTGN
jgi:hypothetical protein